MEIMVMGRGRGDRDGNEIGIEVGMERLMIDGGC